MNTKRFAGLAIAALFYGQAALGLVAAWEALVWLTGLPPYILPPPSRVVVVMAQRFDLLAEQAAWTASEMALGLVLGLVLGAALAVILAASAA